MKEFNALIFFPSFPTFLTSHSSFHFFLSSVLLFIFAHSYSSSFDSHSDVVFTFCLQQFCCGNEEKWNLDMLNLNLCKTSPHSETACHPQKNDQEEGKVELRSKKHCLVELVHSWIHLKSSSFSFIHLVILVLLFLFLFW